MRNSRCRGVLTHISRGAAKLRESMMELLGIRRDLGEPVEMECGAGRDLELHEGSTPIEEITCESEMNEEVIEVDADASEEWTENQSDVYAIEKLSL